MLDDMTFSLSILRPDFDASFTLIRKLCKASPEGEAVLSFDGECLHIELGGMGVTPAARGEWPGQARVRARFILALAKVPPSGEAIEFRVEDGRIRVGTTVANCVWQPAWSRCIELPENASRADVLALPLQYEHDDIEASGYANALKEAEEWRDDRIADALTALRDLGVTREDIEALAHEALRRAHVDS